MHFRASSGHPVQCSGAGVTEEMDLKPWCHTTANQRVAKVMLQTSLWRRMMANSEKGGMGMQLVARRAELVQCLDS
jgi:hypothetical protein